MASSRATRTDLTFLRRRIRPVSAAPAPVEHASTPAAPSHGLVLGASPAATPARPRRELGPQPFPAPAVGDARELDEHSPVLRVDRLRSAIGTLLIIGATSIAWETTTFLTGAATAAGAQLGSQADTAGNRPLLEFDDGAVLVTLRHVRELRRALVIGRDTDALGIRFFDGETLSVPTGAPAALSILSILVVDGMLELRAEPVDPSHSETDVHQEFGFSMTHRFALPDGPA